MSRSIQVAQQWLPKVRSSLGRNNFTSQRVFAMEVGMAKATVSKFFTGKPISHLNFVEICEKLGFDWQEIGEVPFDEEYPSEETTNIYVERPPIEEKCYQEILQPNSLIRIKAPKQMGKTLLAYELLNRVVKQGYRTVYLSFKAIDRSDFKDLTQFLRQFCNIVSTELDVQNQLRKYWQEEIGSKSNCTTYFEKYLLTESNSPLVLCLDDVDLLFPHKEIAQEFLTLLRFWHERAKTRPIWTKLRLIVVHSTENYIPLDLDGSPFNVGLPIELPTFTFDQVRDFVKRHGFSWDLNSINQLIITFNGHPSLIEQALYHLKITPDMTLEKLLQEAPTDSGIYSSNLRNLLLELKSYPKLYEAFKKVIASDEPIYLETVTSYKLHSMGLVQHQQDKIEVSCNLYRLYFQGRL